MVGIRRLNEEREFQVSGFRFQVVGKTLQNQEDADPVIAGSDREYPRVQLSWVQHGIDVPYGSDGRAGLRPGRLPKESSKCPD
jgi:hypothetical protein